MAASTAAATVPSTATAMATAATAMAATTATAATVPAAATTILRIRAGGTANGVWQQHHRRRQHSANSQSQ
ncbi:hypothetical protein ASF02_13255 [Pseudomonas sp. Leaf58]|nr:hypothetical protein ASF02_13255 [Pseudomonas sp. Leaf58]